MNRCKKCRSLFFEHFYGEMESSEKSFFDHHLSVCEKCKLQFEEMEAILQLTGKRTRPEPPEDFWHSYEKKLAQRIESEEEPQIGSGSFWVPRWTYQVAAAVVLVVIGIFLGRFLFSPSIPGLQQASQQPGLISPAQPEAALVHRSQDYIERSKLILLALVNFDPSAEDLYALDLPYQKQVSKELVEEAGILKKELAESDQERLENLIASLEIILLQIANLESDNDLDAIELVRDGIDRRGILMEINLTDLRLSMGKKGSTTPLEQPSRKPKTL